MKTLLEIVEKIDELDEEDVIFVKPEWNPQSEAEIFRLTEDYRMPEAPKIKGLTYFLEVETVHQVLEGFAGRPNVSLMERCQRLIYYAINDA